MVSSSLGVIALSLGLHLHHEALVGGVIILIIDGGLEEVIVIEEKVS